MPPAAAPSTAPVRVAPPLPPTALPSAAPATAPTPVPIAVRFWVSVMVSQPASATDATTQASRVFFVAMVHLRYGVGRYRPPVTCAPATAPDRRYPSGHRRDPSNPGSPSERARGPRTRFGYADRYNAPREGSR